MKFQTHNTANIPFQGSWLIGYVDVSYSTLVKVFGEPVESDGYKTDAEWQILFEDKTYATIYNYKDGKNYCGDDGLETLDITDWHIGGTSPKCVELVKTAISELG
jgi:hypothetical protein